MAHVAERQLPDVAVARERWRAFRVGQGWAATSPALLSPPEANVKFDHTAVPTYGLSLAPADRSEGWNVCRFSTPECRVGCVGTAGRNGFASAARGKITRTRFLADDPTAFLALLCS